MAGGKGGAKPKGGKKNRKHGRNAKRGQSLRYLHEGRYSKNRTRRLRRHLKRQPNDRQAHKALATPRTGKFGG